MNPIAATVKEAARRVAQLRQEVLNRLAPSPAMVKRVPFITSVPFTWLTQDMQLQTQPWVNGAEDAYITGVTYAIQQYPGAANPAFAAAEFGIMGSFAGQAQFPMFDFEWNYLLPSSGLSYVSQANGATYADRRALGNPARGEPLSFRDPLVVPAGDTLMWVLRPTAYSAIGTSPIVAGLTVGVTIVLMGYRTGTMAEADYDRR